MSQRIPHIDPVPGKNRHMATPHYKLSAERDAALVTATTIFLALFVGGCIGASIAVGVMT